MADATATSTSTDVFERVSHETRMEILRVLARARGDSPTDPWVRYSDLREAVGVRDKGNFNYHLDRLEELVVDGPEGYRISTQGFELVSAVASGELDPEWTWGPVDAPGECPFCSDGLQMRYEAGTLRVECGVDEHALLLPASPSLIEDHPDEDVVERVAFLVYDRVSMLRRGICPECRGRVEATVGPGFVVPEHYHFRGQCRRCGCQHDYPVGTAVLPHPAVIDFFAERGTDVRSTPLWTLDFCVPGTETVESTDPLRLRVDLKRDGDALSLVLDGDASVVEVTGPDPE